jgi:hypothetical protein
MRQSVLTLPFQSALHACRMVSLLCDVTYWALSVQHERLYPSDAIAHSDLEVSMLQQLVPLAACWC